MDNYDFDVFVSHASEDKSDFVEPLAKELRRAGLKVWFDKFTLKVGDSLRDSIETGLARSQYGVVVFSKYFLSKNWPKAELNGLFALEMDGRKVILPVWHNITATEMKEALPIQSDKIALLSSDGVAAVARSIIELVRPELLVLETQEDLAAESSSSFLNLAKERHPGYNFAFHSGANPSPPAPGTIASAKKGQHRVDVSISDRALIQAEPTLTITFSEEGARKASELYSTGKPQTWKHGEFTKIEGTVPLLPTGDVSPDQILSARPSLGHIPPKYLRVEVGATDPLTFSLMEMRMVRAGRHEAEAIIRGLSSPLEVGIIFSVNGPQKIEVVFSWNFVGHSCSACKVAIDAFDRLVKGDILRLYDLQANKVAMEGPAVVEQFTEDPLPPELRRVISIAAEAERRFGVSLKFCDVLSEEDTESLFHLDCLLNGRQYGTNLSVPMVLTKQESDASSQGLYFSGQQMSLFLSPSNFPGFFPLFGASVATPPWGLYTEQCVLDGSEDLRSKFDELEVGQSIQFTAVGSTPTFVRWKADCAALLGASGE